MGKGRESIMDKYNLAHFYFSMKYVHTWEEEEEAGLA